MKKKYFRIISLILFLVLFIFPTFVNGWDINSEISGLDGGGGKIVDKTQDIMGTAKRTVQIVAEAMVLIMLLVIGIKYMTSAPEGRAEYKKHAAPYIVGATIVFSVDKIISMIQDNSQIESEVQSRMDMATDVVSMVATSIAFIILLVIGIKYMMSAPEGKAEYRKHATPYIVGATIVFLPNVVINAIKTGDATGLVSGYLTNAQNTAWIVAQAMTTIMLLVLAIKYMSASPEGKAEYKKTAIPYLVGALIVYSTGNILSMIKKRSFTLHTENTMATIIQVLRYAGVGIAIIMLIVLAIKYMTSAPEGKAEFSKTAIPYIVGAVVLYAATSILGIIQEVAIAL